MPVIVNTEVCLGRILDESLPALSFVEELQVACLDGSLV